MLGVGEEGSQGELLGQSPQEACSWLGWSWVSAVPWSTLQTLTNPTKRLETELNRVGRRLAEGGE